LSKGTGVFNSGNTALQVQAFMDQSPYLVTNN